MKRSLFIVGCILTLIACNSEQSQQLDGIWYDPLGLVEMEFSPDQTFEIESFSSLKITKGTYTFDGTYVVTSTNDSMSYKNDTIFANDFAWTENIDLQQQVVGADKIIGELYQLTDTEHKIIDTVDFASDGTYYSYYKEWQREWKLITFSERQYLVMELAADQGEVIRLIGLNDSLMQSIYFNHKENIKQSLLWHRLDR